MIYPLPNRDGMRPRMDPQLKFKKKKQNRSDIVCVWSKTEPAGQLTSESRSSIPDPGPDDSLSAEQRPSGMLPLPFPALRTNWSQVVLPHVWLSCLVSSEAECDMGVVNRIWNGYNEITHLGRCIVSCLDHHVRVRYICYKSPLLLSWEEPGLA